MWQKLIDFFTKCQEFMSDLIKAIFDSQKEKQYGWFKWFWIIVLFLAGALLWGKFLNFGKITFDFHDWAEISAPRVAFIKDAVMKGVLPLHMPDSSALRNVTDRFMSIPDPILSPQIFLLSFMDVGTFILTNTLILYVVGCFGLLWFRKKYALSLGVFTILFFMFNFNGHMLSHFSVGHINYTGYYFFPWLIALIIKLLEGDRSWRWVLITSLLLFFVFLQGSFHHFVWLLLLIGLIGLARWEVFPQVIKVLIFSIFLSMVRILPPALEAAKFDSEFLGGYPTVLDVLKAMVVIVQPSQAFDHRTLLTTLGWWEFDLYVGLFGAAIIIFFGVYKGISSLISDDELLKPFLLPIVVLFVMSIGRVYRIVRLVPIPLFAGERVSSRMIIIPFVIVLILTAIELQKWINEKAAHSLQRISLLGIILLIVHDLWQYLKFWQVANAIQFFPVTPVDLSIKIVANHPDPQYINMLILGGCVSSLTLAFLLIMVLRERKMN